MLCLEILGLIQCLLPNLFGRLLVSTRECIFNRVHQPDLFFKPSGSITVYVFYFRPNRRSINRKLPMKNHDSFKSSAKNMVNLNGQKHVTRKQNVKTQLRNSPPPWTCDIINMAAEGNFQHLTTHQRGRLTMTTASLRDVTAIRACDIINMAATAAGNFKIWQVVDMVDRCDVTYVDAGSKMFSDNDGLIIMVLTTPVTKNACKSF